MAQNVLDTMIGSNDKAADPAAARKHYEAGLEAEARLDRTAAIEAFRQATDLHDDATYMFKLAYHLDLVGEESEALAIYEEVASCENPPLNLLLNLAVIYEDRNEIGRAEKCLRQILDTDPVHERALLYMKDVQASRNMFYDEEHVRDVAKRNAMLDTPVTDFELSVRARNCLKKMQIRTLGDLLKVSEAELLSYKNFGETSLTEIKQMLTNKGMRLGQGLDGQMGRTRNDIYEELKGKAPESVLNKPISVLDLSVRARKALQMLNIQSLGELAMRTEAELMGVKNFGQTSLEEVKRKLQESGLELRQLA